MRHGDKINNLSRTTEHRKALLSNLATQLFIHKRIFTTLAKAKALRVYVEPLITRSKNDTTHNRRIVFSYLKNKEGVKALFDEIRDKILNRNGGYTRIIKVGHRKGDAAEMAMIELVDFNELYTNNKSTKTTKKSKTRRGGSKSKKTTEPTTEDNINTPSSSDTTQDSKDTNTENSTQ